MDDKVIVTNRAAMLRKYGEKGVTAVEKALKALLSADGKRGIRSRVVFLDDAAAMKKLKGKAVTNPKDPRQAKAAVDAVFRALGPDYLMILGAPDVVPHQDLKNLAGDDDEVAWGDLPYACEAPYSRNAETFIGPTRVVGRMPDLSGAKEPSYLLGLLRTAAGHEPRPKAEYLAFFGLSAEVWKGSTALSLANVFGSSNGLLLAPPAGPGYPGGELKARTHFINCHGGPASPEFYGQHGSSYPVALTTRDTAGQVTEGAVAAVECCYGAELYDSVTLSINMPICQSYLEQGACAYFGSTTIAYGPADTNGAADLICQHFLLNVLDGASVGRAALLARQQFVDGVAQMDPIDLKTLSQFCLLGDPSVHPVRPAAAAGVPKGLSESEAERFFRAERRAKLQQAGAFLRKTKPTAARREVKAAIAPKVRTALSNIAVQAGLRRAQPFGAFGVTRPAGAGASAGKASATPTRYHVAVGLPEGAAPDARMLLVAVVAKELSGRIVGYRIYHRR